MATRNRLPALLASAVVALALLAAPSTAPPAAAADSCEGVWVVVDARALGGSITTRCAPGSPNTGLDALRAAGHSYSFVPEQPGFVCTIDRRPDPCPGVPPTDAYWSYWHAPQGGSWTYSNRGAGNRTPAPGTVEGWAFGDGSRPPGITPPVNPTPRPTETSRPSPAPTGTPSPSPSPPATGGGASDGGSRDGGSTGGGTGAPSSRTGTAGGGSSNGGNGDRPDAGTSPDQATPDAPEATASAPTPDRATEEPTDREDATDPETPEADEASDDQPATDDPRPDVTFRAVEDDTVALEGPGRGGGGTPVGLVAGGTLAAALGVAAARRGRRRDVDR